ncbi:MAG: hypothetical protein JKY53_06430, partial [Flavobacteriales bacterium]|nr:hypothetical protein [Flavobacteriales bacterium]
MISRFQNIFQTKLLSLLIVFSLYGYSAFAGGPKYSVTAFSQYWCQIAPYPTAYATVSWSINETDKKGFKKSQTNKTIVIDLPAGFEFDITSATASVAGSIGGDITACTFVYNSTTQITVTLTTDGNEGEVDAILFTNFEIRALASGNSGNVYRTGGSFKVDGATSNPTATESLGFLLAGLPMIVDSIRVNQISTQINRQCGTNSGIIEIAVSTKNTCPGVITEFRLNTNGDAGFSENEVTNITNASIYYTGTTQGMSSSNFFGTVAVGAGGAFTITGSQALSDGDTTYYFYLAYDVPGTANVGDQLDGMLDSLVFNGGYESTILSANPTGTRTIIDAICYRPDVPGFTPNIEAIPTGSYIIPMDLTNQSEGAAPFNLQAYGLVNDLLMNDVPVKWVITTGKAKDGIDFTAMSSKVYPSAAASASISYTAGAFVVDTSVLNTPQNGFVLSAAAVFAAYGNSVAVYELDEDKNLDVRYTLTQRPYIAVFSNGGNEQVHIDILDAAGVTNYTVVGAGVFTGILECYTFCSEPHWDGGGVSPPETTSDVTDNVENFIQAGGNFLAQCRGIDTYENFSTGNIVSTAGINILNASDNTLIYSNPDMAIMQFEGGWNIDEGGSEKNWILNAGSSWVNGFYYAISGDNLDTIIVSGAHVINKDSVGGNVFYMGGHDYEPYTTDILQINSARVYLNAALIPSGRPSEFDLDPGAGFSVCSGSSVTIGGSPTSDEAGATFLWEPAASLDDPTKANPVATPAVTTVYSVFAYNGGCPAGPLSVTVTVVSAPTATISNSDTTVCTLAPTIAVSGSVTVATGQTWTSSGTGTFADNLAASTTYTFSAADTALTSIKLYLTATGGCAAVKDSIEVTFQNAPTVNAGVDQTVCGNVAGVVMAASCTNCGLGTWTTGGTGTFDNNLATATYDQTTADTTAGSVALTWTVVGTGQCATYSVFDVMSVTFTDAPTIEAGPNQSVCADNSDATMVSSFTGAATAVWTTSGTGTFDDNNSTTAIYTPSDADTTTGIVTLTFTTLPFGSCPSISDNMAVTYSNAVAMNAGPNQTVCGNNANVTLTGTHNGVATAWVWTTSGTGTFDDASLLAPVYTPSVADTGTGTITLTLTSTVQGNCNPNSDDMVVTISNAPFINAGADQVVCGNNADVTLVASHNGVATAFLWTSSSGDGTFDNEFATSTIYHPSVTDTTNGTVTLTLTSTAQGICNPTSDALIVTITDAPTMDPGPDQTVCANNSDATMAATMTIATAGIWTTAGDGTFDVATNLNAVYTPGSGDITATTAVLTFTTTAQGACTAVSDFMTLTISPAPVVDAGLGQIVCGNNRDVSLVGTSNAVATAWLWTTNGTGTFAANTPLLTAYTPSDADTATGNITLTLTSTAQGICNSVNDFMIITITDASNVNANVDQTVCANNRNVTLAGTSNAIATAWLWTSSGTGGFDDATSLTAVYTPSDADTATGVINLTLTSTIHGSCNADSDVMNVTITNAPVINANIDQIVCGNNADVTLAGSGYATITAQIWTTSGTGTFNTATIYAPVYTPSAADTAAGTITLTLTSTAQGNCSAVNDPMSVTITNAPSIDAGLGQTVCSTAPNVTVTGTHNGVATAFLWTSSGTGTFSAATLLTTGYQPSNADTAAGTVTLTLSSTAQGTCNPTSDFLIITITDAPIVNAGANQTVCANNADVSLAGTSTAGATAWLWTSSSASGTFDNATLLATTYHPSTTDTSNGTVTLTLTSTAQGSCAPATDNMVVTITDAPFINTISDATVCGNNVNVTITATDNSVATAWLWS